MTREARTHTHSWTASLQGLRSKQGQPAANTLAVTSAAGGPSEVSYTWVLLCGMWAIVFLLKLYYTMLFLWLLPMFVVIYGVVIHAFPYCFSGITACPPHTGPAVAFDVMKQTQGGHKHIALGPTDIPHTRRTPGDPRAPHPGREKGE